MNRLQITSALIKAGWQKSDIDCLYDSGYSDDEIMEQAGLKDTKTVTTQENDYAHDDLSDVCTSIAVGDFDFTPDSVYVTLPNKQRINRHRINGMIDRAIDEFLTERMEEAEKNGQEGFNMTAEEIEEDIIERIQTLVELENVDRPKNAKYSVNAFNTLTNHMIARIVLATGRVANIRVAGGELIPAYYYNKGKFEGTWRLDINKDGEEHQSIAGLVRQLNPSANKTDVSNVIEEIFCSAPNRTETTNRNLVAVNNGVFNRKTKEFMEWGDERLKNCTFTKKIPHNYVPHATAPVFNDCGDGEDWDFDSWLLDLMDGNKDAVKTLWEVFADCVMPYAFTERRAVFFIDGSSGGGSNGKGSLCDFISCLCGGDDNASRTVISLSLKKWSDRFSLAGLPLATVSIADENGVGLYIDDIENLKAAITCDRVNCEAKFKTQFMYQPYVVIIFCMNSYPKVKDPSGSWLRRLLVIKFCKRFVGKNNKTYIKYEYLHREELMEYVLAKLLEEYSDIDRFTMYPYQEENLLQYQDQTDSAFRFMEEHYEQFAWDVVPFNFLYLMYSQWYQMSYNKKTTTSLDKFKDSVVAWCDYHKDAWTCDGDVDRTNYNKMVFKSPSKDEKKSMELEEPLISEYKLYEADTKHSYNFVTNVKNPLITNSIKPIPAKVSGIHRVRGGVQ